MGSSDQKPSNLSGGEPTYYRRTLTVGDPDNCVGICTLWTPQEKISRQLEPHEYGRIGNLYSRDGINHIVRNVFAEPIVRYVIVCGIDLTGSGEALLRLARNGVDSDHRIVGDPGLIDREIPAWAIDEFREKVTLVDLRGTTDVNMIRSTIATLPPLSVFGPPRFFPTTPAESRTFPSEQTGFVERGKRVADIWLRLLGLANRFGDEVWLADGSRTKRLRNVSAVVRSEDPRSFHIPEWLPVTDEYLRSITFPYLFNSTPPEGLADSDGRRLYNDRGVDQIARIAEELRADPQSTKAVATVWDPAVDTGNPLATSILSLNATISGGALALAVNLRDVDLYRSWPETAFAFRELQSRLAGATGDMQLGPLSLVCQSLSIPDDAWTLAEDVVDQNRRRVVRRPRRDDRDPRGSFVIRVEKGEIHVDHYSPDGIKLQELHGSTAAGLALQIQPYISQIDHALHIGSELQKAELALLEQDYLFVQDHPLERRLTRHEPPH